MLSLPANVRLHGPGGGGAGAVLVSRAQFLRLIEQCRRFPPRQRRVAREDLEPEEIFIISDPLAHGFVTMKKVRRIVGSMGLSLQDPAVKQQLVRLGRECAEDNYVVTYDRFIVFVERLRQELLGMGVPAVLDLDLSNEARKAQKDVKATRAHIVETARRAAEEQGQLARGQHHDQHDAAAERSAQDKEYLQALATLLEQTEDWEAKAPAERERALNLLRVHAVEAAKRKKAADGAALALEGRISNLHDRALRQTAYAKVPPRDARGARRGVGLPRVRPFHARGNERVAAVRPASAAPRGEGPLRAFGSCKDDERQPCAAALTPSPHRAPPVRLLHRCF